MAAVNPNRLEVGRAITAAFGALGANFGFYALLSLALIALPSCLNVWIVDQITGNAPLSGNPTLATLQATYLQSIAVIFTGIFVTGAVITGAVSHFNGERATAQQCLNAGLANWWPLFALNWLAGLAYLAGYVLLIVPGVMLAVAWYVLSAVYVVERPAQLTSCFGRAADLTRGHRWTVFGYLIVMTILAALIGGVAGFVVGFIYGFAHAVAGVTFDVQLFEQPLTQMVTLPLQAVAIAAAYHQLAGPHGEGERLAQVFA